MPLTVEPATLEDALELLRRLRARQAVTLMAFAVVSIVAGGVMFSVDGPHRPFWNAVAWQFVVWAAIDAVFAGMGIVQAVRVTGRPPCPQTEADEFAAAEKLLRTLHFNQKLNWFWLACGVGLMVWAGLAHNPSLAGHGVGVLIQGGFLFVFDWIYAARFGRLLYPPTV